jgi:hypothetical protein
MASCDDLFQRKLALDLDKQANDEELARVSQIQRSRIPSDDEFRKAQKIAQDPKTDAANRAAAEEAIEQQQDAAGGVDPRVNIADGQPINYKQRLRDYPEEVVADYATLTRNLRQGGAAAMPEEFALKGYTSPRNRAQMLQTLSERGSVAGWLRTITNSGERFTGLIDDVVVVRFAHDTAKDVYAAGAEEAFQWVLKNPGKAVPADMELKLFNQFKVATMAQRHYDYVRGAWGRIGNALQGRGFEGPLKEFVDEDVIRAVDEAQEMISTSEAIASIEQAGQIKPEEVIKGTSFGNILEAFDKAQTNPKAAEGQLAIEIQNILITGASPEKYQSAKELRYNKLRNYNLMTKDWQLFNERTNALNLGSNGIMALFGPYRQFLEDSMEFAETVGTSRSRATLEAWQSNWNGVGASMLAIRDAGKEVFMDSFVRGKSMYANNVDTYGARYQAPEELVAELKDIQRGGAPNGNVAQKIGSLVNPERYGRFFHAATRLWMYEKTGSSYFLRPGLRTMGAVDNLAGYGAAVYKLRHDLEVKYRFEGIQKELMNEAGPQLPKEEAQRLTNNRIMEDFNKAFYSTQPTEAEIIAFRRESGIPAEFLDDQGIADMIAEQRVGENYSGMIPGEMTREASAFSEEMRFANKPDGAMKEIYEGADKMRRQPWVEAAMPYFRAPFLGTGFDVDMLGVFPGLRKVMFSDRMTPKQRRRNTANLIMAGHVYAMWGTLSASDLITSNGPAVVPGDPQSAQRRQQWLLKMKKQGRRPNSIAGVTLPGGLPIINTVFLMEDIKENFMYAASSRFDQLDVVEAVVGVLMGHLSRSSAIGQVQTLMETAYGNPYQQDRAGAFAGYMAQGRYLPSGPMRSLERASGSGQQNLYRDEAWTEQDFDALDAEGQAWMQTMERRLRNVAYNVSGLTGVFGGKYKDKDWLGSDIRKPWGMDFATYLKDRFDPVEHPEGKVYTELNRLQQLNRPEELAVRRLRDVPMTDDMQKYWNESYSAIEGRDDTDISLVDGVPKVSLKVRVPIFDITTAQGIRVKEDATLMDVDVTPLLNEVVKGNNVMTAYQRLFDSPLYKEMEANEVTKFDRTSPSQEQSAAPSVQMVKAVKRYYAGLTTAKMLNMDNPPAEVEQWREQQLMMNQTVQDQILRNSGRSEMLKEAEARANAFSNVLEQAQ